jgi:hypothetical protein
MIRFNYELRAGNIHQINFFKRRENLDSKNKIYADDLLGYFFINLED